ncbi:MAG: carbon monoxide dehydrogenase subunit G [Hyphomicrobiales bacterium]|nr:carbon monoxide dehydrogenase subunit G [Hyphomicrobiales bacterium]
MAMTMKGEVDLPATKEVVWKALNDPEVLKSCIPGCESLEKIDDNTLAATAKVKVGPVSASFKGKVNLLDLDPPNGYRIEGEGEGGVAGFAKGGAVVKLSDIPTGTKLTYDVEAQVGGKLAQLGARLIDGVAKKMADQFFADFAAAVGKQEGVAAPAEAQASAAAPAPAQNSEAKGWLQRLIAWFMDLWR